MRTLFNFLLHHGYLVVLVTVFVDQFGIPFPAVPFLIAAGALARSGDLSLVGVAGVAIATAIAAHAVWYEAGRRMRGDVLGFMCRLSLEPDLCVRRAQNFFARQGNRALIFSYFVPGFGILAAPIAGMLRMSRWVFLGLNAIGAVLWAGVALTLGYLLSAQVESLLETAAQLGGSSLTLLAVAFVAYLGWKVIQRQLVFRDLRLARITPEELKQRLDQRQPTVVLDLRHRLEFEGDARTIPGAIRMAPEELEQRHGEIPRDVEVVLYCS
jgi:membrane protein DedA with SNARE-associated domain